MSTSTRQSLLLCYLALNRSHMCMFVNQCMVQQCVQYVREPSMMKHRPSELPIGLACPQSSIIHTSISCLGIATMTAKVPCGHTTTHEAARGCCMLPDSYSEDAQAKLALHTAAVSIIVKGYKWRVGSHPTPYLAKNFFDCFWCQCIQSLMWNGINCHC